MDLFEKASRVKLRFSTRIGELAAEDLWDLPLTGRHALRRANAQLVKRGVKPAADPTKRPE